MKILDQKKAATILSLVVLLVPFSVMAQESIGTVCGGPDCGFYDIIELANKIINFLLYKVSIPLVALGFMYAGARMVLYQKKEAEWTKTKEMFQDIAMGFGYMLGIYVLIKFVLSQFLDTRFTLFLFQ